MASESKIPSCYEAYDVDVEQQTVKQELFVVIDQTTVMNPSVQKTIFNSTKKFIKRGNSINIITFSSNAGNRYMEIAFSGFIEPELTKKQRNSQSKKTLRKFDKCMKKQYQFAANEVYSALTNGFKNSTSKIPKSDIFKSLYQLTEHGVKYSKAKEKIVLLSSDMLENSSITSFYANGSLKTINPNKEFARFIDSELIGDFDNSRVYVIGAGTVQKKGYNDPKKMKRLKGFWKQYFVKNNGKLIEFGEPMLLGTVH